MKSVGFIKKFTRSKSFTLLTVLIAVIILFAVLNKNFLSIDNIRNILIAASLSGTLTVGIGCLLIAGIPDLSAGAVGCMAGLLAAMLMNAGFGWVLSLLIAMAFGAFIGVLNAAFFTKLRMNPFIATLAMASVLSGLCNVITAGQSIAITNVAFQKIGTGWFLGMPIPFIIMLVLYIAYGLMLKYTNFGRSIYMVGGNRNAARLAGINAQKIYTMLMVNCSMIAALGGTILVGRMYSATPSSVQGAEIDGIIASCLGGISFMGGGGGMLGGFIGLLLLNCFNNGLTVTGLNTYWHVVASGLLLVAALSVDFLNDQLRKKSLKVITEKG